MTWIASDLIIKSMGIFILIFVALTSSANPVIGHTFIINDVLKINSDDCDGALEKFSETFFSPIHDETRFVFEYTGACIGIQDLGFFLSAYLIVEPLSPEFSKDVENYFLSTQGADIDGAPFKLRRVTQILADLQGRWGVVTQNPDRHFEEIAWQNGSRAFQSIAEVNAELETASAKFDGPVIEDLYTYLAQWMNPVDLEFARNKAKPESNYIEGLVNLFFITESGVSSRVDNYKRLGRDCQGPCL